MSSRTISKKQIDEHQNMRDSFNPYAVGGLFGQYKMMQITWKLTETLALGYSSESTDSKSYPINPYAAGG